MNIFKLAFSLLSLAAVASSAPSPKSDANVEKRDFCIRYNTQDCREFKLFQVNSADVDKHIIVANASNVPKEVPTFLHGAFYMKGNSLADEVLSIANGWYDDKQKAYFVRTYEANTWSWDDSVQGKLLYDSVRTFGLTYKLTWGTPDTNALNVIQVEPIFYAPAWLGNGDITIKEYYANFTVIPTPDPNFFIRRSSFVQKPVPDYEFIKILNADGSRTDKYESEYLERIGKGAFNAPPGFSNGTHLEKTQLFAKLA
ncbi:hypothetical protein HDU97_006537 [Phlyctochytrium planicorne]|nr:hypothetical protein HDU97_006537 [Phlyctochytrium planicorne]